MFVVLVRADDCEQRQHGSFRVRVRACDDLERDVVCELRAEQVQEQLLERGVLLVSVESADAEHWRCKLQLMRVRARSSVEWHAVLSVSDRAIRQYMGPLLHLHCLCINVHHSDNRQRILCSLRVRAWQNLGVWLLYQLRSQQLQVEPLLALHAAITCRRS